MKFFSSLVLLLLLASTTLLAADEPAAAAVDSGSFGIFVSNKRTATEKFSIQQSADGRRPAVV